MNNIEAVKKLREDYNKAKKEETEARDKAHKCAEAMQAWCEHPLEYIVEASYRENSFFTDDPPVRLCTLCGLTEQGWGSYNKLAPEHYSSLRPISRDDLFMQRILFR